MTRDWMVRKISNELLGPMTVDEVKSWVTSGKLGPNDELCSTGDYWFFVHEVDEVRARLGVEPPQSAPERSLEATQAITKTLQTKEVASELPELTPKSKLRETQASGTVQASHVIQPKQVSAPTVAQTAESRRQRSGFEGLLLWKWATFILAFGLIVVTAKVFMMAKPLSGQSEPRSSEITPDLQKTNQ